MKKERGSLGSRMKRYEISTKMLLPRRCATIIRIDGKAFHTFTKKAKVEKPFDRTLMKNMDAAALHLCNEIQGAQFAYVQSDEISILLTDFETVNTDAWFDGNVQKIASVSASMCTSAFMSYAGREKLPWRDWMIAFDSRVFSIPDPVEVINYYHWRWIDWERNSIQMLARSMYSHKECHKKNSAALHDMIHEKGKNWADLDKDLKNGRILMRVPEKFTTPQNEVVTRMKFRSKPMFNLKEESEKEEFKKLIPERGY